MPGMTAVYLLATLQALFLIALLAAKPRRSLADWVLMAWLSGIGLHTALTGWARLPGMQIPLLINLNAGFAFLQGPFLLAWVAALVGRRDRLAWRDALHLLPYVLYVTWLAWMHGTGVLSVSGHAQTRTISLFSLGWLFNAALLLSIPAYIAASLVILRRAGQALGEPALPARFRWIRACIAALGLVWLATVASLALRQFTGLAASPHGVFWALTLFVYALGYLGLTRTTIFREAEMTQLQQALQPRYRKSGLGPDEARLLHAELVEHMARERPWLDGDLTLQRLAAHMGLSANHLSQVINEVEGKPFRDYLSALRVEEACRRLDAAPDANLLELGLACGFNAKSSFNRAFRKHTGQSPSEYAHSR